MGETKDKEKFAAMIIHLSGSVMFCLGIALFNIILPLLLWHRKKDSSFLDFQRREAIRFQIFVTIYVLIAITLLPFLSSIFSLELKTTYATFNFLALLINPSFSALAALQALKNVPYCYPAIFSPYNPRRKLLKQKSEE